jgi:hypothetical protein
MEKLDILISLCKSLPITIIAQGIVFLNFIDEHFFYINLCTLVDLNKYGDDDQKRRFEEWLQVYNKHQ